MTKRKINKFKEAKGIICDLCDNDSNVLIIHYSCESLDDIKDGKTPRITSIAVRYLNTGQTKSFSLHNMAEINNIKDSEIVNNFDDLERSMLIDYFKFLRDNISYRWVHWNMRDISYGFEAIKHRGIVLGLEPVELKDENKIDLSRLLLDIYGEKYSEHPRLDSIIEMNKISHSHLMTGKDEALAFSNGEFVKLHQSNLSKTRVLEDIIRFIAAGKFKTKSTWRDIYGISPQGIFELCKDNCWFNIFINLLSILLGILIGKYLG